MSFQSKVKIAAIELDSSIQCRAQIDTALVSEYAERMTDGDKFPPVDLFGTKEKCWIGDGWHRVMAARQIDAKDIPAIVHPGERADALKHALHANAVHGMRRSNADKRRCVEIALKEFPKLSDRAVADLCGVGAPMVAQYRPVNCNNITVEKRIGLDGKERPASRPTSPSPADPDIIPGFNESDLDDTKPEEKEVKKIEKQSVSDAEQFADMAIRQLERIRSDDPNILQELTRVSEWIAKRKRDL